MINVKYSHLLPVFAVAAVAALASPDRAGERGERHRTFAEAPGRRSEKAQQARLRAMRDKNEVAVWASRRGVQMRHEDGRRLREIMAIRNNRPLIYTTQNADAGISTAADQVHETAPFYVDGSSVTVGLWDGGIARTDHQELSNRVFAADSGPHYWHSTHVAGTIGASGVVPEAKGMAPQVLIDSYDWDSDYYEMVSAAAASAGEEGSIYLSNHSYGIMSGWFFASFVNPWTRKSGYHFFGDITTGWSDPFFGQYGRGPRNWDAVVYDAPYYLPFKAAGNERDDNPVEGNTVYYTVDDGVTWTNAVFDPAIHTKGDGVIKNGYDTIPYYGTAKNILTIGAVTDAVTDGQRDSSAAGYTSFTSWGPADDGRIKPDLVANGDALYSCEEESTTYYNTRSGTSMSSPNACGSAALLVDYYRQLFPGHDMRASTLKGLLIHTADDIGRPGPDYQYGWGLLNTRKAAEVIQGPYNGNLVTLNEILLTDPSSMAKTNYAYSAGEEPIRVTLCWTDPPGKATEGRDVRVPVLVNDLDLQVIGPDGTRHYPFRLNYADPEAVAVTDGKNAVDNVEQVLIPAPEPGLYIITVEVDGSLRYPEQWYSLITSGVISDITDMYGYDADSDGMPDLWEMAYFSNPTGGMDSADMDGDGMDNMDEFIAGSDPTDPASFFRITSLDAGTPVEQGSRIINWNSVPGRVYNVYWTHDLRFPYENISGELHWPITSFTDTAGQHRDTGFYWIDVELAP